MVGPALPPRVGKRRDAATRRHKALLRDSGAEERLQGVIRGAVQSSEGARDVRPARLRFFEPMPMNAPQLPGGQVEQPCV